MASLRSHHWLRFSTSVVRSSTPVLRLFGGLGVASLALACNGDPDAPGQEGGGFISHVPGGDGDRGGDGDVASPGDENAGDGDGDGAERVIAEADIIQLHGSLLYALSQFSGMTIVDVSNPADLQIVGNYRTSATPFEMYLEGGTAYVMYNGWYSLVYDEQLESHRWETTSRMQAVDVSDPESPHMIGDYEVSGSIVDSRKVGDVIYLATHETSWCYGCDGTPKSRVASFDVSVPSQFTPVDEVAFQNDDSWQRSISVSQERIYVAGWTWDDQQGSIDVVDISDPSGELTLGATVPIAGQIESRWQMDEHEGILRVISQPGGWGTTNPPVVETFQINSADDLAKLASLPMVLPRPEDLRSVRFDGTRAFAITFERTDPLFTFDLSDPAAPAQVGELEIPGWVYHMEPRGDRVYALGFEDGVDGGALHVSLFDVSDMGNPTQIDRVNFGGDWGSFAEDQDRIHKAFNILADEGLILVPFSGTEYEENGCNWNYRSGIQLVDMTADSLTLRGVAPQVGSARRALLVDGTLFGVTDNAVQTFDISDRDAPEEIDQLDVARNVSSIHVVGSTMLRFGSDWWTDRSILDFSTLEGVESPEPLGEIDLSEFVGYSDDYCEYVDGRYSYEYGYWGGGVFVHGSYAYLPRYHVEEAEDSNTGKWSYETTLTFLIVDISERTAPFLAGTFDVEPTDGSKNAYYGGIVQTEGALLVGRHSNGNVGPFENAGGERRFSYDVIDLSGGDTLEVVERIQLPAAYATGGFGSMVGGCTIDMDWGWYGGWWGGYYGGGAAVGALVSDDIVTSQHAVPLNDGTGRVRYYLDRIDMTDPRSPQVLEPINIPGQVVHFDAKGQRLVTVDYVLETRPALSWNDCYDDSNYYGYFDEQRRQCRVYRRRLNLLSIDGDQATLLDRKEIDRELRAQSIAVSDQRVFYNTVSYSDDAGPIEQRVGAIAIGSSGFTDLGEAPIESGGYYWGSLVARDGRAFLSQDNELTVVDATGSDVKATAHEMGGWYCASLEVTETTAYCAMGEHGVRAIPLDP